MNKSLFVYGVLRDPRVQQTLLGRTLEGRRETLKGYKLVLEGGKWPFPYIEKGLPSDEVEGIVLELTEDEMEKCAVFETPDFTRRRETLNSGEQAWIFFQK